MQSRSQTPYLLARKTVGLSRERAAELTYVSTESVRDYEQGKTIPPNDWVCRAVEIYPAPWLAYQHLIYSSEVARKCLPKIKFQDLPSAILRVQKEVTDFLNRRDELIAISYDGVISPEERPQFDAIMKELGDIAEAFFTLKYAAPEGSVHDDDSDD